MWLRYPPDNVMDHIAEEKYYDPKTAWYRLVLVAKHINDPDKIREMEKRWLKL